MANANHLMIGLGGTGGKIIRSFRKTVFQHFRAEQAKGANLRYLYIDSSDEREALMTQVIAEVEAIKAERKNPLDKAVRAYSEAARIADTILQRR
jgi:Tubulin like